MGLETILRKLDWLRESDTAFELFGASRHRYALNPPASQEELASFEQRFGVELPEEYREFLSLAGNGGAGPDYGLVPLGTPVPRTQASPSRSFVMREGWDSSVGEPAVPEGADLLDGCLLLNEKGCGYFHFLAVNGPSAGQVWVDHSAGDGWVDPVAPGFNAWCEQRFDQALTTWAVGAIEEMNLRGEWTVDSRLERLEELLMKAASSAPTSANGWYAVGLFKVYRGCLAEARAHFEKATELGAAHDVRGGLGLCAVARRAGDVRQGAAAIAAVLARRPRSPRDVKALDCYRAWAGLLPD